MWLLLGGSLCFIAGLAVNVQHRIDLTIAPDTFGSLEIETLKYENKAWHTEVVTVEKGDMRRLSRVVAGVNKEELYQLYDASSSTVYTVERATWLMF